MIDQNAKPQTGQSEDGEDARFERLNRLGKSLARTRKEAVEARRASGIEEVWREDEEHYEGVDDLNRGHVQSSWQSKPPGQANLVPQNQSTEFVNITRPYVDAAAAKVGDILLPTDERAWSLTETPVPEPLEQKAKGILPEETKNGMRSAGMSPEQIEQVAATEQAEAEKAIAEAKARAQKAEKRIEDWHIEGQLHAEMRKVIDDAARIGTGILKGPVPAAKRHQMYREGALVVLDETKPISKRIDPKNFFPDGACGESIHNGRYVWERDFLTPKQLAALKRELDKDGKPIYIGEQIDACLAEGPAHRTEVRQTMEGRSLDDKDLFEIWYYHGQAEAEDMEAAGCKCPDKSVRVPAIFTLVNDRVIKGALNPLDTGEFPYDVIPWQRRANSPWGAGVARQIRTPQRIVTAATRHMLTNAGRAAGPIFVVRRNVEPADGSGTFDFTPWKVFLASDDDSTDDANKMMAMFQIPDLQQSLMAIIQYGLKLAEDVTGLPLLLQGQVGSAPETLGGQQLADRNASGVMRRLARAWDDCITEPHVRRYYAWLLQYGEDDEKGEFVIDARGSTALVERDIYKQELQIHLQAALNPAFGLNPEKIMEELLRVSKRDPKKFMLTDEEKQAQAEAAQGQQPQDTSLEVANIRAQTELQKAQANQAADMAEIQAKAAEAEKQRAHDREMRNLEFQIKLLEYSEKRGMTIDKVKSDLARDVMKVRAQERMNERSAQAKQIVKPPVEPVGRAPAGQAFQR